MMNQNEVIHFIESALLASDKPLKIEKIMDLFEEVEKPKKSFIRECIGKLQDEYKSRNIELIEVASGFRIQVTPETSKKLDKLWEWRSPRYSRALFETLALIAYKQPITRGEIELVRGVSVSTNIIKSLIERDWIYVTGQRDVPGRPEMFGTTKTFLDYFGLKSVAELPPLTDLSDWEAIKIKLDIPDVKQNQVASKPEMNPLLTEGIDSHEDENVLEHQQEMEIAKKISDSNFDDLIDLGDHEELNPEDTRQEKPQEQDK
tara:strand:- start:626 stop:1408 length:783 start_codon:yes stop_codon:yes gene_type:complete